MNRPVCSFSSEKVLSHYVVRLCKKKLKIKHKFQTNLDHTKNSRPKSVWALFEDLASKSVRRREAKRDPSLP